MDRFWFITWHTYATWLPGSERGFVGVTRDDQHAKVVANTPGTPCRADFPGLRAYARSHLKGAPIHLTQAAARLLEQLQETSRVRGWTLLAVSIAPTHVHVLVAVVDDPDPEKVMGDFKAWGSRALTADWSKPANGSWWAQSGSKRKKSGAEALCQAIDYVRQQHDAWIIWIADAEVIDKALRCARRAAGVGLPVSARADNA